MTTTLVIRAEFSDDSDFDYFRAKMVDAVEEVATVATEGDDEIGEPARADGTIEVSWDTEE